MGTSASCVGSVRDSQLLVCRMARAPHRGRGCGALFICAVVVNAKAAHIKAAKRGSDRWGIKMMPVWI